MFNRNPKILTGKKITKYPNVSLQYLLRCNIGGWNDIYKIGALK